MTSYVSIFVSWHPIVRGPFNKKSYQFLRLKIKVLLYEEI